MALSILSSLVTQKIKKRASLPLIFRPSSLCFRRSATSPPPETLSTCLYHLPQKSLNSYALVRRLHSLPVLPHLSKPISSRVRLTSPRLAPACPSFSSSKNESHCGLSFSSSSFSIFWTSSAVGSFFPSALSRLIPIGSSDSTSEIQR